MKVLLAQGMALLFGLQLCSTLGYLDVDFEVDSLALVHFIFSSSISAWPICNVIAKISMMILLNFNCQVRHIFRYANLVADSLVSLDGNSEIVIHTPASLLLRIRGLLHL